MVELSAGVVPANVTDPERSIHLAIDQVIPITDTDALIVVDPQIDFMPGGLLSVPRGNEIIPIVNRLMYQFTTVVMTQDWHPADHLSFASNNPGSEPYETIDAPYGTQVLWPDHCIAGSVGAAFHPQVDLTLVDIILRKGCNATIDSYSGFVENDHQTHTGLAGFLRERRIDRCFVVGLALDYCVGWTALDAVRYGFQSVVIEDACRAIDLNGSLQAIHTRFALNGVQSIESKALVT